MVFEYMFHILDKHPLLPLSIKTMIESYQEEIYRLQVLMASKLFKMWRTIIIVSTKEDAYCFGESDFLLSIKIDPPSVDEKSI